MRLLILSVLSQYGLACKYRIISQRSMYWMQNCIFRYFWYCIFIFLRSNYNSYAISTCYNKSDALWYDELRVVSLEHHLGDN